MPDRNDPSGGSVAAGVDHHPPVPVLDGHRDQSVLRPVEPVGRVEPGRRQQRAVQPVAPPVVRAVDRPVRARRSARRQFVGAVLAGVVEAAQLAVVAADQQYGVVTDLDGPSGTDRGEVVRPPRAHPGAGEEVRPLPRQDGVVEVGGRRQHRSRAAGVEHRRQVGRVDRRRRGLGPSPSTPPAAPPSDSSRTRHLEPLRPPPPAGVGRARGACTAAPGCRSRRRLRASPTSTGTAPGSAS